MAREITRKTQFPLAVATIIDFLYGYLNDSPPASEIDKKFQEKMTSLDPQKKITKRLVKNFESIPLKFKTQTFGRFDPGVFRGYSNTNLKIIFSQAVVSKLFFEDDVSEAPPPKYPPGTNFTIEFTGLYCRDRTGDRIIIGPSDEPYVITVAVHVENGENVQRSELHPVGDPDKHYDDLDDGESRVGPIAAVWYGKSNEVSLIVVVMEHDEGDQSYYRDEIELAIKSASYLALLLGIKIPDFIQGLIADLLVWLIDSEDDEIGTYVEVISPEWLRRYANQATFKYVNYRDVFKPVNPFGFEKVRIEDNTNLDYHFVTKHDSSGEYYITFKVKADRLPVDIPETDGILIRPISSLANRKL